MYSDSFRFVKQKLLRIKFSTENLVDAYLYLPQEWNWGAPKFAIFWYIYNILELESKFTLGMSAAKNTNCIKNDSNNNYSELNFLQKHGGRISLSPPGVELGGFKDCNCFNIMMYWNGKIDSL